MFYIAFYRTSIFQHAHIQMRIFYARQRIKDGHCVRIFQAFLYGVPSVKDEIACNLAEIADFMQFS